MSTKAQNTSLLDGLSIDANLTKELTKAMSVYEQTRCVYQSVNIALGREVGYSIVNSSSTNINVDSNGSQTTGKIKIH